MSAFHDWAAAGFDVIPVIPPGAKLSPASKVRPEDRGKVPGRLNGSGCWSSFDWISHQVTGADLAAWDQSGASTGVKAGNAVPIDIDITDDGLAGVVEGCAQRAFGSAPCRVGRAPKRLLMCRTAIPMKRVRLWFRDHNGEQQLIEVLGEGQQAVVDGIHPKTGKPYEWDLSPTLFGLDGLPEVTAESVEQFLQDAQQMLALLGCTDFSREGSGGPAADRTGIDQSHLVGDLDRVREAVAVIPNDNERFPTRTDYIRMGCAIKAALPNHPVEAFGIFSDWAYRWEGNDRFAENDPDTVESDWQRMHPPFEIGAPWIFEYARDFGFSTAGDDFEAVEDAEKPAGPVEWSDQALALRFVQAQQDNLRYVSGWGKWLLWDGTRWDRDRTEDAADRAKAACAEASAEARRSIPRASEADRTAKSLASAKTVTNVMQLARTDRRLARSTDIWDTDLWALNTPSGTVDLRTGEVRPHNPADQITRMAGVPVGRSNQCPRWLQFLDDTFGDPELIAYMKRLLGYALVGEIREHVLAFGYGDGGTGKGTLIETVSAIMGDYASTAAMDAFIQARGDRQSNDLATLSGARLVTAQETQEGRRWDEGRIKTLTGGDRITCRFLRQEFFTYMPQFTLFLVGNHKPELGAVDNSIARRMHLIPFTRKPATVDEELRTKLAAEGPAILAWVIEGCLAWQRLGLSAPASVKAATREYLLDFDPISQWINDRCVVGDTRKAKSKELFEDFQEWCGENGEKGMTRRAFTEALKKKGFETGLIGPAEERSRALLGIDLERRSEFTEVC